MSSYINPYCNDIFLFLLLDLNRFKIIHLFFDFLKYYNYFMINLIIYLNGIEESGDDGKFVEELLSYMDDKIK